MSLLINASHITNQKPFWVSRAIAGEGIDIQNGDTQPIITNTGVLTATAGNGISNVGTGQNPIFQNEGIIAITPGAGISVSPGQDATITNDGVRTATAGTGIEIDGTNDITVYNLGVLSVSNGSSITIGGGVQTPIISNPDFYRRDFFSTFNIVNQAGTSEIVALRVDNIILAPNTTYMQTFSFNNYTISALPGVANYYIISRIIPTGLGYPSIIGNLLIQNNNAVWSDGRVGTFTTTNATSYYYELRVNVGLAQPNRLNLQNIQTKLFRVS
jgi:hypothetical protein